MSGVDELMKGVGNVIKTVPEIYEDGLQETVKESGKVLSLIPKTINAAFAPLRKWIAVRENNVAETEKLLAKKLENVEPEKIVSPEPHVAVPAIQAISYCMDSEDLRNMYANLLAESMLVDKKHKAHPSYVEIIKQLSPDEAKLLKKISMNGNSYPLIDIRINTADSGYINYLSNFTVLAEGVCDNPEQIFSYLDNLERLKLIDIPPMVKIYDDTAYSELENYEDIKQILNSPLPDGSSWQIIKKKFEVTNYGRGFIEVCVKDEK